MRNPEKDKKGVLNFNCEVSAVNFKECAVNIYLEVCVI